VPNQERRKIDGSSEQVPRTRINLGTIDVNTLGY
jgi:hypothetical protein